MIIFKDARKRFFTGLAVLLPIVLTIITVKYVFHLADGIVVDPLFEALPFAVDRKMAVVLVKFLLLVGVILSVYLLGLGTEVFIVKNILKAIEGLVQKIPMVNRVYGTIKEIINAFMGEKRDLFMRAVLVEFPQKGMYAIAFVTKPRNPVIEKKLSESEMTSVFLPTTPNPTTGFLLYLAKRDLIDLPIPIDEAIKLVISGGAVGFAEFKDEVLKANPELPASPAGLHGRV